MSKRINGGTIGLSDRKARYSRAKAILGGKTVSAAPRKKNSTSARTLRRGMKGNDVKKMQKILGIAADGIFGFGTASAVKKWQRANGLTPDGIVGPRTQAKMFG
jgi:peptidoglycan hydrolase-like protein with peptidoglycan-binding domain